MLVNSQSWTIERTKKHKSLLMKIMELWTPVDPYGEEKETENSVLCERSFSDEVFFQNFVEEMMGKGDLLCYCLTITVIIIVECFLYRI